MEMKKGKTGRGMLHCICFEELRPTVRILVSFYWSEMTFLPFGHFVILMSYSEVTWGCKRCILG
ncbi:hypothetical protein Hanom_Chr17g01562011 [Helianthus anomalus]